MRMAGEVPYRMLNHVSTHGDPAAENMLIQGDNLEALKALLPFYRGRVKCIYIDPPYNTKTAFEHYDDNLEHSQWLSMMYPRFELLREFLTEDGSIWVSIDDNEGHYLKVLMDEVFGRRNFLTTFVWQKSYGGGAKAKHFVGLHEYIHAYAKDVEKLPDFFWPPDKDALKYYKFKDEHIEAKGPYRLQPLATTSNDERPNLRYPILNDDGEVIWPEKQWQWSKERVAETRAKNGIVILKRKGKYSVSYKQYLRDESGEERQSKPKTIIAGHYTQHGTYESIALFGMENKFGFPKPEGLIERVFQSCTKPDDLVLDSFVGSGTALATAHKMKRRYIGIEMRAHATTHCLPRLEKVIAGEQGGISKSVGWQGGGGFKFLALGEPIFSEAGIINPNVKFTTLASFIWLQETGVPSAQEFNSPCLGLHGVTAYYLLYNGVLGDKRPESGNVLTGAVMRAIHDIFPHSGPKVIYGESCRLGPQTLAREQIVFRQIPYDIRAK